MKQVAPFTMQVLMVMLSLLKMFLERFLNGGEGYMLVNNRGDTIC
ncbi:MAG: hypothetical protein QXO15_03630 [Nitrososphaerota archaeon]